MATQAQRNTALARMEPFGKEFPRFTAGTVTVADGITAVNVVTGLKTVISAVGTSVGATVVGVTIAKTGGTIAVKGAAAATIDWIAVGY